MAKNPIETTVTTGLPLKKSVITEYIPAIPV